MKDARALLRQTAHEKGLQDLIVVVERTGRYHRPVQLALLAHGIETRIVPPYATKQFRQVAHPGPKTDTNDLFAMQRAAANGFALQEPELDPFWASFRALARYRRTLIHLAARLRTRIRNYVDDYLPGFVDHAFHDFFSNNCAWPIAGAVLSASEIRALGIPGLAQLLHDRGVRSQERSLQPVLAWAAEALPPDSAPAMFQRIARALGDERQEKLRHIRALESELVQFLCHTPYVLLLSCPGLNVATVADMAAELGPIDNYTSAKEINGRAGLTPSRYQSGQVDRADGPLVKCAKRKLRAALLRGADALLRSHDCFHGAGAARKEAGANPHAVVVKTANRFNRILYRLVAGREVFNHPQCKKRHDLLGKLIDFHSEHASDSNRVQGNLEAARKFLPTDALAAEAASLQERLTTLKRGRARDPLGLTGLLPKVLAELGAPRVESKGSGVTSPR